MFGVELGASSRVLELMTLLPLPLGCDLLNRSF